MEELGNSKGTSMFSAGIQVEAFVATFRRLVPPTTADLSGLTSTSSDESLIPIFS